jgi:hypothetical protein
VFVFGYCMIMLIKGETGSQVQNVLDGGDLPHLKTLNGPELIYDPMMKIGNVHDNFVWQVTRTPFPFSLRAARSASPRTYPIGWRRNRSYPSIRCWRVILCGVRA